MADMDPDMDTDMDKGYSICEKKCEHEHGKDSQKNINKYFFIITIKILLKDPK